MIHGLSAQLGGMLELSSTPGVGTRVEMWLPAFEGDGGDAVTSLTSAVQLGEGVVLLVDDEDLVRSSTSQMLSDLGFTVVEASSGQAALTAASDPDLLLIVTDHLMPGMTGAELAREVQARRPGIPVLIISGFAELDTIAPDLPRLMKPFRESELAAALAALRGRSVHSPRRTEASHTR
jgi:CheY-like chemotaxis protein